MDPTVVLVGATLLFAAGATGLATGCRACQRYPRGQAVLGVVATVTGACAVLLFLDGRITRYFPTLLWSVPIAGVAAGGLAGWSRPRSQTSATAAVVLWTAVFALTFAARLPWGVSPGSASTIGLGIEVLAALLVSVPGFVVGSLIVGLLRRRAEAGPDNGLRSA
ncbi:MAG: hypothetical protein ACI8U4_001979 [Natronomonas sp.]|jgi:hypothetical protein